MSAPVPPVPAPFGIEDPFSPFQTEATQIKALMATDPRAALRMYAGLQQGERSTTGASSSVLDALTGIRESEAFRAAGFGGTPYGDEDGLYRRLASQEALTTPAQLAAAEQAQGDAVRSRYAAGQAQEEADALAASQPNAPVEGAPISGADAFAIANSRDGLNQLQKRIQGLERGNPFRDAYLSGAVRFNPETRQFEGRMPSAPTAPNPAEPNFAGLRTYLPKTPSATMTAPNTVNQNLADDPFSVFGQTGPAQTKPGAIGTLSPSVAGNMAGGAIQPDGGSADPAGDMVGASALAPVNEMPVLKMDPADPFPYAADPDPVDLPKNPTPSEPVPGTPSGGPVGGPGGGPTAPETPPVGGTKPYGGPRTDIPVPAAPGGTRPYTGPRGTIPMGNAFGRPQSAGANPAGGMSGIGAQGLTALGRKRQGGFGRGYAPGRPYSTATPLATPFGTDFRKVGRRPMGPTAPTFPAA